MNSEINIKGLSTSEAQRLLKVHGLNTLVEDRRKNIIILFLSQFKDLLSILLLIAAGLSFFISNVIDAALILAIIVLNAIFKIYQESKAEEALVALKKIAITTTRVLRDGKEIEIDSRYLVPGDIIKIEEGGKIPADAKVLEAISLEINEASLTGEAMPVFKNVNDGVYMGTIVLKGRAVMQITETGMKTKFGEIAGSLSKIDKTSTPLQRKLKDLLRIVGIAGIFISLIVLALSFFQGSGYLPAIILAISLAVAVVPEGLPAVTTITLALGVREMAKRKAIVRRLEAIEAIGSITLIATDKTGTLTTNEMRVKELFIDRKIYEEHNFPGIDNLSFHKLITDGILCSTASLLYVHDSGTWDILGDPTEGSLLLMAQQKGVSPEALRKEWKIVKEMPFDSITKTMSVTVKKDNHNEITFTKGAPEPVIEKCEKITIVGKEEVFSHEKKEEVKRVFEQWTKKGLRVLAFSYDNVFLGMVAIHDPPRPEVKEAVQKAYRAGIKVVMITGDNERTAETIGVAVGIIKEGDLIMTGNQIEESTDEELLEKLPKVKAFARTNPIHKSRIVSLYQKLGEIVAVTGDGVNDAIALKQADVGVSMGKVGTDVARETSDIVIMDDNFATIVKAVEEGRNIVRNLKNSVKYQLSTNASEGLSLIIGIMLGIPNLFIAVQLLYINLIGDGIPALALAFSPKEGHLMEKLPEKKLKLLKSFDQLYIVFVAFMATGIILGSYFMFRTFGEGLGKTAAFSALAMIQSFVFIDLWLSHRPLRNHLRQLISPLFILAFMLPIFNQFWITKVPFLANIFKVETVSNSIFMQFLMISAIAIFGVGIIKKIVRNR